MALRDLLIDCASFSCCPVASLLPTLSLPAKSTNVSFPFVSSPVRRLVVVTTSDMSRCERDDSAFMRVDEVARCFRPESSSMISSAREWAVHCRAPSTCTRPVGLCSASTILSFDVSPSFGPFCRAGSFAALPVVK